MIIGKIHPGSGLGDQLFSYIITRVIALDRGFEFGFVGKEHFKGSSFMNLDWGKEVKFEDHIGLPACQLIIDEPHKLFVFDKPYYDPEVNFIEDGTVIDGYGAQDERYFEHRLDEVKGWLKTVAPWFKITEEKELCVLNIRGGEYRGIQDLILPLKDYWFKALGTINEKGGKEFKYEIHTDDYQYCKGMIGDAFPIHSGIEMNWFAIRYAKNAIISNSAFAIIPRLLKHLDDPEAVTIAPRFWAGRNVSEWRRPQNYYKKFTYI